MMNYTGIKVIETASEIIARLHEDKEITFWDARLKLEQCQNMYVILKPKIDVSGSTVGKVVGRKVILFNPSYEKVSGLRPLNREQNIAMDMLLDNNINVVGLEGETGSGKTLMCLAAAIKGFEEGIYKKIILTRPMTEVGKYRLGLLPGTVEEKFGPYLENYKCNLERLLPNKGYTGEDYIYHIMKLYNVNIVPLQLIRGASWYKAFIIADEAQTLSTQEMLTLGTRVGEGSKIAIAGDLDQRDEKIARTQTGMFKLFNSPLAKQSEKIAVLRLLKCVRSETARIFSAIFKETQ